MPPPNSYELLDNSDELAEIAADESLPRERRDSAMEMLAPFVRRSASRSAARFAPRLRQELISLGLALIWERIAKFDPRRGSFEPWCSVVLFRAFQDEVKSVREPEAVGRKGADNEIDPADETDVWQPMIAAWHQRRERTRRILDALGPLAGSKATVDYLAVLLLRLRQSVAAEVSELPAVVTELRYAPSEFQHGTPHPEVYQRNKSHSASL